MRLRPLAAVALLALLAAGCETGEGGGVYSSSIPPPGSVAAMDRTADPNADVREASAEPNREGYDAVDHNPFVRPAFDPLSTFALDVDTASYTNVRRLLNEGTKPPAGAVRVENFVNYFDYGYPSPLDDDGQGPAVAATADLVSCPWAPDHDLLRVAVKAREVDPDDRPAANLVFLVDVSGSMNSPDKLPLVKLALRRLLDALRPDDRVGIVVYAGSSGTALPSTPASRRDEIELAIDGLSAGGSTHGAAGIVAAYGLARDGFVDGGVNRVVLCTDGDFNVGPSSQSELVTLIRDEAKSGVYLSVLGFGTGNYQDAAMEALSDHGNGNFAYVDTAAEAERVLGRRALATLVAVARDVKVQTEFNPSEVAAYRLIGYENRVMADEEFRDDSADAGEVGAGHEVTAFYEVVPYGAEVPGGEVGDLRYQRPAEATPQAQAGEVAVVKVRYQPPDDLNAPAREFAKIVSQGDRREFDAADDDLRFAAAAAAFAMVLRDSPHAGAADLDLVRGLARDAVGDDPHGDRREMLGLVDAAARAR